MRKNYVLKMSELLATFLPSNGTSEKNYPVLFCSQVSSDPRSISLNNPLSRKSVLKAESSCRESGGWGIITMSSAAHKAVLGQWSSDWIGGQTLLRVTGGKLGGMQ